MWSNLITWPGSARRTFHSTTTVAPPRLSSAIEIANFQYAFGMPASNQGEERAGSMKDAGLQVEGRRTNAQFKFQFYMRGSRGSPGRALDLKQSRIGIGIRIRWSFCQERKSHDWLHFPPFPSLQLAFCNRRRQPQVAFSFQTNSLSCSCSSSGFYSRNVSCTLSEK